MLLRALTDEPDRLWSHITFRYSRHVIRAFATFVKRGHGIPDHEWLDILICGTRT